MMIEQPTGRHYLDHYKHFEIDEEKKPKNEPGKLSNTQKE